MARKLKLKKTIAEGGTLSVYVEATDTVVPNEVIKVRVPVVGTYAASYVKTAVKNRLRSMLSDNNGDLLTGQAYIDKFTELSNESDVVDADQSARDLKAQQATQAVTDLSSQIDVEFDA